MNLIYFHKNAGSNLMFRAFHFNIPNIQRMIEKNVRSVVYVHQIHPIVDVRVMRIRSIKVGSDIDCHQTVNGLFLANTTTTTAAIATRK